MSLLVTIQLLVGLFEIPVAVEEIPVPGLSLSPVPPIYGTENPEALKT